jgi:hypothetical protein
MTLDILDEFDRGVLRESGMTAFVPILLKKSVFPKRSNIDG